MDTSWQPVLLIDDDVEIHQLLVASLALDRVRLDCLVDGLEAIERCRIQTPRLILLDLGLPKNDGFTVLQRLKEDPQLKDIPVIILTAWNSTDDKVRGFELGATDYVTKPYELAELRARVRSALRSKLLQDELARTNQELDAARVAAESATRSGRR
jgi:DNA-binding response OmpR family regulator